jgi:hypothetical protein
MSVTGGALYVSKLTTNNSKLACIAIWLYDETFIVKIETEHRRWSHVFNSFEQPSRLLKRLKILKLF